MKRKSGIIRIAAAILSAVTLGTLCCSAVSCGGKDGGNSLYAYDSADIPVKEEYRSDGLQLLGWMDGKVYYTGMGQDSDGYNQTHLLYVSEDGSEEGEIPLNLPARENGTNAAANIFTLAEDGVWFAEQTMDLNNVTDGRAEVHYYLRKIAFSGENILRTEITDQVIDTGVNFMEALDDGRLLISGQNKIFIFSGGSCELLCQSEGWLNGFVRCRDGGIYVSGFEKKVQKLDIDEKKLENVGLPEDKYLSDSHQMYGGPDYDFYFFSYGGIRGINIGDDGSALICGLQDSDLGNVTLRNIIALDDGRFLCQPRNNSTNVSDTIIMLTKRSPDAAPKIKLTIGGISDSAEIRNAAALFNKTNEKYRVELINYTDGGDMSAGLTKLNSEIAAGRCPDMLLIDPVMPYDSYVSKGILTDLYALDGVSDVLKSDRMTTNIFRSMERGGKLFSAVGSYVIITLEAPKSAVISALGAEPGHLDADDLAAICAVRPDAAPFADIPKTYFGMFMSYFAFSQFADTESGECSFESDDFMKLLDFAASLPEQSPAQLNGNMNEVYDVLSSGKALLRLGQIDRLAQYWEDRMICYNGDMSLIGFPGHAASGTMPFLSNSEIGVCSSASDKEGCAEFIRFLYDDRCQYEMTALPVLRSALEKKAADAQEKVAIRSYSVGGERVNLGPIEDEAVSELLGYISKLDLYIRLDETASGIVMEEVSAFLAGAKTAGECAALIQNRVLNMLKERK